MTFDSKYLPLIPAMYLIRYNSETFVSTVDISSFGCYINNTEF